MMATVYLKDIYFIGCHLPKAFVKEKLIQRNGFWQRSLNIRAKVF